jgi:hypothetical protein
LSRRRRPARRRGTLLVAGLLAASCLPAQILSNLEPERPLAVEDAIPIPYRAISAAVDWTYNLRRGGLNDQGPGLTVSWGVFRDLEIGAAQRYVTRPGRNALRGIASGDLELHALYGLVSEGRQRPAIATRVGVVFPTGLDSRGTDLELGAIATRSFDAFRFHASFRWTRLGDIVPTERADRVEGAFAVDFLASRAGRTDTLLLADVTVRSSPLITGNAIVDVEVGARHRIGIQTVAFGVLGSQISDTPDRPRLRMRVGISHFF